MLRDGIVRKIYKDTAEVEIVRSTACGEGCASCGLCGGQTAVVTALNSIGASEGDTVTVDLAGKKVLGAAFLVYIVPLAALFAGYFIIMAVTGKELWSVLDGFVLMAAVFALISFSDKRLRKKYTPKIIGVKGKGNEGI